MLFYSFICVFFSSLKRKLPQTIFLDFIFFITSLHCIQGNIQICQNVYPSVQRTNPENCSLVCSLKFQQAVSSSNSDEVALCTKNSSIGIACVNHADCRQYHAGAYCVMIPCLCKTKTGSSETYILDSSLQIPKLSTCVVSAKYLNVDLPVVPFPWKTLLIVCAIVFVFATCLLCLRWISPLIRQMQAKRATRTNRERERSTEDNTTLFTTVTQQPESTPFTYYTPRGVPRIYRASPRRPHHGHRASSRARYAACAQAEAGTTDTLTNQDKPPPYEAAVQLPPPSYEDVERAINESRTNQARKQTTNQRVEVHVTTI